MNHTKSALLHFPTTVLLVDDDATFLANIGLKLGKHIPLKLCNNPFESLALLQQTVTVENLIHKLISAWDESNTDPTMDYILRADIKNLHNHVYNQDRFSCISTVLIDYSMPGLNGVELCEKLEKIPVKKIMLTGEADFVTAVKLFNSKLIDHFVIKDSAKMPAELDAAIHSCQKAYFSAASSALLDYLAQRSACFSNLMFWEFIEKFFQENNFSEYYVLDVSGSVLFLDFTGRPTWLIVKSSDEIDSLIDIAADHDAENHIIHALQEKIKIPFFFTEQDQRAPVTAWQHYMHTAMPLPGIENYYYAVVKEETNSRLAKQKILSHKRYLHTIL